MVMDFSTANPNGQFSGGELIPAGTLAWAVVTVRPFNMDQGQTVTMSKSTEGNGYIDLELTISDGPFVRRKIWDMPGVMGSEKYVQGGFAAVRHILEVGKQAGPTNAAGYQINDFMELDGLNCAIEVTIEKGKDGYADKNKCRYLSPNPESDTHKKFERLVKGDTAPAAAAAKTTAAPAAPAKPAWGPQATGAAQVAQPGPTQAVTPQTSNATVGAGNSATAAAPTASPSKSWGPQAAQATAPGAKPAWIGSPAG